MNYDTYKQRTPEDDYNDRHKSRREKTEADFEAEREEETANEIEIEKLEIIKENLDEK